MGIISDSGHITGLEKNGNQDKKNDQNSEWESIDSSLDDWIMLRKPELFGLI